MTPENNTVFGENAIKLHIPLVVSDDIEKQDVQTLLRLQQAKIVDQVEELVKEPTSAFRQSFDTEVEGIRKKLVDTFNIEDIKGIKILEESINILDPYNKNTKSKLPIGKAVGAVKSSGNDLYSAVGVLTKKSDVIDVKGSRLQFANNAKEFEISGSSYTVIEISSSKLVGMLTRRTIKIFVRTYVISISAEKLASGFKASLKDYVKAIKKVSKRAKSEDYTSLIGSSDRETKLSAVIADDILDNRAWVNLLRDRRFGASMAISSDVAAVLAENDYDVRDKFELKKLVDTYNIFDFFVIGEDALFQLDMLTFNFNELPFKAISSTSTKKVVKIDLTDS